jgi:hypothetical protein
MSTAHTAHEAPPAPAPRLEVGPAQIVGLALLAVAPSK